jgi:hypothetical protein
MHPSRRYAVRTSLGDWLGPAARHQPLAARCGRPAPRADHSPAPDRSAPRPEPGGAMHATRSRRCVHGCSGTCRTACGDAQRPLNGPRTGRRSSRRPSRHVPFSRFRGEIFSGGGVETLGVFTFGHPPPMSPGGSWSHSGQQWSPRNRRRESQDASVVRQCRQHLGSGLSRAVLMRFFS